LRSCTARFVVIALLVGGCSSPDGEEETTLPPRGEPEEPDEAGCFVQGASYASGTRVPDPVSCNRCTCSDGRLVDCTEMACPRPCAQGTRYGHSCRRPGSDDGCLEVEVGCLPACSVHADCDPFASCASEGVCATFYP